MGRFCPTEVGAASFILAAIILVACFLQGQRKQGLDAASGTDPSHGVAGMVILLDVSAMLQTEIAAVWFCR